MIKIVVTAKEQKKNDKTKLFFISWQIQVVNATVILFRIVVLATVYIVKTRITL